MPLAPEEIERTALLRELGQLLSNLEHVSELTEKAKRMLSGNVKLRACVELNLHRATIDRQIVDLLSPRSKIVRPSAGN